MPRDLDQVMAEHSKAVNPPHPLYEGIVAEAATSPTDEITVLRPEFSELLRQGPCRFQLTQGKNLPQRGDRCLLAYDENGDPWIVYWESQAAIIDFQPEIDALEASDVAMDARVDALELGPNPNWFKYAEHTGAELPINNDGVQIPMNNSLSITAGSVNETWLFNAVMLVRANSANDTPFRHRIQETVTATEVGVSFSQRTYWNGGGNALSGYTSVPIQGRYVVAAGATRTFRVEVNSQSPFGGNAYAGGATHNNLSARRVA